jgi:hypothetical protein
MRLAVRSLLALFVTAFITASPTTASASEFSFLDDGPGGIIIWDGALDVATMQNQCPQQLCITTALGAITPEALRVLVSLGSPVTFSSFSLNLVLSLPSAGFPSADCATYQIGCQTAFSFLNGYNGFECLDQGVLANCAPDPGTHSVAILPMGLVGGGSVGNGSQFEFQLSSRNFLNAHLALWQTARIGFQAFFQEDLADGQFAVPFTLSLQDTSTPAAVPEPGTMLLLGSGLAMTARRLRRRQ